MPSPTDALPKVMEATFAEPDETAPAFLQFTSGTTSQPKALLVDNRTLLDNVRSLASAREWNHEDVIVSWLPLYHDMGLVALTMSGFVAGMPVVVMPSNLFTMNPARWLWAIHTFKGTVTSAPNFAYQFVATHAPEHRTRGLDLSTLRCAINAAEFIQSRTIAHFTNRFAPHGFRKEAFAPAYGLAECTVAGIDHASCGYRVLRYCLASAPHRARCCRNHRRGGPRRLAHRMRRACARRP